MRVKSLLLAVVGVLALYGSARAERVRGTFRFADPGRGLQPVKRALVEVWQLDRGAWFWGHTYTAFTNADGVLDITIPFRGRDTWTSLRVYAVNDAVDVYRMDEPHQKFYQKPGPANAAFQFPAFDGSESFDFTYDFADAWTSAHFNIADAIPIAKAYADARRDPNETDVIGKVTVKVLNNAHNTFFEPTLHEVRTTVANAAGDRAMVHEYAHFLEARISGFYGVASFHDGCVFQAWQGGPEIGNAGTAWMEGFAEYFAHAVALAHPDELAISHSFTTLENPSSNCTPTASKPADSIEQFVTAALWDLIDESPSEAGDRYCSTSSFATDRIIFQIFDRELDLGRNPTLQEFANAWINRNLDLPPALTTWGITASPLIMPATTHRYNASPAADFAVWRRSEAFWYVLGQPYAYHWGDAGSDDVPVPADYDGDGFTDLAIWRPSTGIWWVILSRTDRVQTTQWGMAGDVPLPADYDGDGEIDFAIYRASQQGVWIKNDNCGDDRFVWVGAGTPVVGHFDSDGREDPGVYDAATTTFTIQTTAFGALSMPMPVTQYFAMPVLGDYDGDGKSEHATFEWLIGRWTIRSSIDGQTAAYTYGTLHMQGKQRVYATPVPADYDADGMTDMAVWYRNDGIWHVLGSQAGPYAQQWGAPGDVPVPAR